MCVAKVSESVGECNGEERRVLGSVMGRGDEVCRERISEYWGV